MTFKEAQDKALELFWKIRPQAQERNLDADIRFSVDGTTYGVMDKPYETLDFTICYFTKDASGKSKYNPVLRFYVSTQYSDDLEERFVKLEDDLKKEGFAL